MSYIGKAVGDILGVVGRTHLQDQRYNRVSMSKECQHGAD
ncbi:hypothetical protein BALAC2494_02083 [Bifidobacterium animalis subsp. lactis CNCM I-2494]|uniref:Uncharacterized protein n=1 Tax=Bifidobacterium animalis subsp. lactis CNCM I-2494 TaxID=1042403 RepID=A0A806FIG2_BIFAN|nr:hypothetical protein BALAC2494_02083 [Bifidobacterium animalis subsp. lactis CNCM I-2494]